MEIVRRRNKSPAARSVVGRRETLTSPGTMRRVYDPRSQRTIFASSRPKKRSREEIAGAKLTQRANGGYQQKQLDEGERLEAP